MILPPLEVEKGLRVHRGPAMIEYVRLQNSQSASCFAPGGENAEGNDGSH